MSTRSPPLIRSTTLGVRAGARGLVGGLDLAPGFILDSVAVRENRALAGLRRIVRRRPRFPGSGCAVILPSASRKSSRGTSPSILAPNATRTPFCSMLTMRPALRVPRPNLRSFGRRSAQPAPRSRIVSSSLSSPAFADAVRQSRHGRAGNPCEARLYGNGRNCGALRLRRKPRPQTEPPRAWTCPRGLRQAREWSLLRRRRVRPIRKIGGGQWRRRRRAGASGG